jgi:hypothetical protein
MTAALGPWMMRHPEVKNNMEAFVVQFVTPEFRAQEGYLRAVVGLFPFFEMVFPDEQFRFCFLLLYLM